MKLHRSILMLLLFAIAFPAFEQQSASTVPQWQSSNKSDLSSGTRNVQFTLAGKFLTAPQSGTSDHPMLIVNCNPERKVRGLLGKFVSTSLNVGAPVKIDYVEPQEIKAGISYYPKVTVQVRVDDRKAEEAQWPPNSDKTGANLDKGALKKLVYDRKVPVRRVEISANENHGGQIVMQFDMPDPTQMVNTCGIAEHK